MKKKILVLLAALALPACTDPYGNPDPAATALVGAAAGAAIGFGVAQASAPRHDTYYPYESRAYYGAPRGRYYARPYRGRTYYNARYQRPPAYYRRGPNHGW